MIILLYGNSLKSYKRKAPIRFCISSSWWFCVCCCICMFPDKCVFFLVSLSNNCFLCDCLTLNTRIYLLIALSDFEQTFTNTHTRSKTILLFTNNNYEKKIGKFVSAIKINLIYSCFCLQNYQWCTLFAFDWIHFTGI